MSVALDPTPLLEALHEGGVESIIVGGFAVIAHGYIRQTKDLDIVPAGGTENLGRLAALLAALGAKPAESGDFDADEFPMDATRVEDLAFGGNFRLDTTLGSLDVMQWIAGIDAEDLYAELEASAVTGDLDGIPLKVCGLRHLRAMKRAAGRPRDLDDLEHLPDEPAA